MSYVRKRISWKMTLLSWNQDPCLMDLDSQHVTTVTFLRHRQRNPSGILGCADHVISLPHVLHYTLLRSKAHILHKLDSHVPVTEQTREKCSDHRLPAASHVHMTTSERTASPQAFPVIDNKFNYFLRLYIAKQETDDVMNVAFPRKVWLIDRYIQRVGLWVVQRNAKIKVNGIHVCC